MKNSLKILILTTSILTLASSFIPRLLSILALSSAGVSRLYLWQFFTYIFVEITPFSLGLLFSLAFNMYLLFIFGPPLYERISSFKFFSLYFGSALAGSLTSTLIPHFVLASSTNPVFGVMIAWALLNRKSELLLFFTVPFKAYTLILAILMITFLSDLLSGNWPAALSLCAASCFSYLFTLLIIEKKLSFSFKKDRKSKGKIYDFPSGNPLLSDEEFMDAMLDRISRHGEDSLTVEEKKRMRDISRKRK